MVMARRFIGPIGASTVGAEFSIVHQPRLRVAHIGGDESCCPRGAATIKTAARAEEWLDCLKLTYDAYCRAGLCPPNRYRLRVTPWQLLPTSEILLASAGKKVLCTVTLVADGAQGLPLESLYEFEVAERRARGMKLAEVSCLADRQACGRSSFAVLQRLMSFTAQLAARRGVDELVIAVHPRHARFYERLFAFQQFGEEKAYALVCDHPAVALSLDLTRLAADHPAAHQRLFGPSFASALFAYHAMPDKLRTRLAMLAEATTEYAGAA